MSVLPLAREMFPMYFVAFRAVINQWYMQTCVPAMRKEWARSVILLKPGSLLLPSFFFLLPTPILVDQHLGHHALARLLRTFNSLISALPPELSAPILVPWGPWLLNVWFVQKSRAWAHLGVLILQLYHVGRERMTINLYRLLSRVELDSSCLIADWMSLQNALHWLVLCETALCHLQYLQFFNSTADESYDLQII